METMESTALPTLTFSSMFTSSMTSYSSNAETTGARTARLAAVQLIIFRFIIPAIVFVGFVGNVINIAVLTRRSMRLSTTNRYLTCLAVCDMLYLVFVLTLGLKHSYPAIGPTREYAIYAAYVGRPLTDTWSNTGVWLTVTFTVERYICVSHPMKGIVWCTVSRANHVIMAVCVAATLVTFPEFFAMTIAANSVRAMCLFRHVASKATNANTTEWKVVFNELGKSRGYSLGYVYINQALFTFLPLGFLIVFNSLLVRSLWRAARARKSMTVAVAATSRKSHVTKSSSSALDSSMGRQTTGHVTAAPATGASGSTASGAADNRITLMLIVVSVVFLVCQVPQAVCQCIQMYSVAVAGQVTTEMKLVNTIMNLLVVINCSINFILYSTMSTKFRRTVKKVFSSRRKSHQHQYMAATVDGTAGNVTSLQTPKSNFGRRQVTNSFGK